MKAEDWDRNPYFYKENTPYSWIRRKYHCPSCLEEMKIIAEDEKRIEDEKQAKRLAEGPSGRLEKIPFIMSRIFPKKFANVDFALAESFRPYTIPNEKGLCLTGKPGVGKTMLMAIIVREYLKAEAIDKKWGANHWENFSSPWKFICYPEFIMELQNSYKKENKEETALSMLEVIADKKYLIIDDLGAEKPTEYVRQATYYIINHREMHCLPTFITTNFSLDFLDENIDSRIASRICGMCDIKQIIAEDRRKPIK